MTLYRYEDMKTWDGVLVYLLKFPVIKETPCGYWFLTLNYHGMDTKRWVSKTSRKRFAHPTIEGAKESFRCRKERQLLILNAQIEHVKEAMKCELPND